MRVADKNEMLRVLNEDGTLTNDFEQRKVIHNNGIYHQEIGFIPVTTGGGVHITSKAKQK